MTQNDVMQLMIFKDIGAGRTTATGSQILEAADLADGEIAVVNTHNVVLDAVTVLTDDIVAQSGIRLIQRTGNILIHSDIIAQDQILKYKGATDAAAAEQIDYVGYNGTAGEIEVNNSTMYCIRMTGREVDQLGQGMQWIKNFNYKSDAAATQEEVALGLALNASKVLRRSIEPKTPPAYVELLNSAAVTGLNCFDNDATLTNGQKVFSVATSIQYNSTDAVVGDYVRFAANPASGTGTALTDGVYRIEAIDSLNITLDRPFEGTSGTYAAADDEAEVIPAATAIAADFGLRFTGKERNFGLPKHRYSKAAWHLGLDEGFGDTLKTNSQTMSLGSGTYEQIAELEWDLYGLLGDKYRGDFLFQRAYEDAVSTAAYDVIGITFYGAHPTQGIGAPPKRSKQLLIALETGFANNEAPDLLVDTLDAYAGISSGVGV